MLTLEIAKSVVTGSQFDYPFDGEIWLENVWLQPGYLANGCSLCNFANELPLFSCQQATFVLFSLLKVCQCVFSLSKGWRTNCDSLVPSKNPSILDLHDRFPTWGVCKGTLHFKPR